MTTNIIFAGTPTIADEQLQALLNNDMRPVLVLTQPDRPAGRGKKLTPSPVKQTAIAQDIPIYQPDTLQSEAALERIRSCRADLMIVVAYGCLLPQAILDCPRYGCLNVHVSLLPLWRGAAPIARAIAAGDKETGISFMKMDAGLDTGPIYEQHTISIADTDSSATLSAKLSQLSQKTLPTLIRDVITNHKIPVPQTNDGASYAKKINKAEACIDWSQSATQIARNIRAFNPQPVAYSQFNTLRVKIWKASVVLKQQDCTPGTIIRINNKQLLVQCGIDALAIDILQIPGGKPLPIAAMLNGRHPFEEGKKFD